MDSHMEETRKARCAGGYGASRSLSACTILLFTACKLSELCSFRFFRKLHYIGSID